MKNVCTWKTKWWKTRYKTNKKNDGRPDIKIKDGKKNIKIIMSIIKEKIGKRNINSADKMI